MIAVGYNHTNTSKSTVSYIYMPLPNKYVRYCHTNINDCFFNGAFTRTTSQSLYLHKTLTTVAKLKNLRNVFKSKYDF